ncbi:MAG TPA: MFS transporter [bacterium]|nr:MFS transporter [bacterium]HNS48389.1 MFS transporter [bacterium]
MRRIDTETRALLAISLAFFFGFAGSGSIQSYLSPYLKGVLGVSPLRSALVLTLVYITMAAGRVFSPVAIGRIGVGRLLFLGAVSFALFPLVFGFWTAYPLFLVAAVLWGAGSSFFWTGGMAELLNHSRPDRYAANQGIMRLTQQVGQVGGFFLLGQLLALQSAAGVRAGFQVLFRTAALISLMMPFTLLLLPRAASDYHPISPFDILRAAVSRRRWVVSLALFASGVSYGILLNLLNLFVSERFGVAWMNKTLVFFFIAAGLFSYLGGAFSDRFGRREGFLLAFASGAFGTALLALVPTRPAAGLTALLLGVVFGVVPTVATGLVGDRTRPGERVAGLAGVFLWRDLGAMVSIFSGGLLLQGAVSYRAIMWVFSAIFVLLCLLFGRADLTAGGRISKLEEPARV